MTSALPARPQGLCPARGGARAGALAAVLSCALAAGLHMPLARAGDAPPHVVQAPHYGDTLFQFFQGQHFSAITGLMASQQLGRLSPHQDEAELLRGGMLLSYGLHREATDIFTRLIDQHAAPAVRDRAWFYLARIRHQRGDADAAEAALGRIAQPLTPELETERSLLRAQLLMDRGNFADAAQLLRDIPADAPASRLARFNLGVAQVKTDQATRGEDTLDELGREDARTPDELALRDRANVALGFAALAQKRPQAAREYLMRVRLNGTEANKALLGVGWAADLSRGPQQALQTWLALSERGLSDVASLEAQVAVPYAYARLGAYGQAMSQYQTAIAAFEAERTRLDESIAELRSGRVVDALLASNPGEGLGEGWRITHLPPLPHATQMSNLLSQHRFQEGFKNLRDLRFLQAHLLAWKDKLGMFQDMLDTRRQAFEGRVPQVRARASAQAIEALRQRRDAVAADVAQAQQDADGVALADARERELLQRVARVQALTQRPDAPPELAQARERVRLAAGALTWRLAQAQPERLWEAKKAVQAIDEGLNASLQREAALAQAQQDEPARFAAFAQRIQAIGPLIDQTMPRIAALFQDQQVALQDIAVAELDRQKAVLNDYLVQARFAVAQLHDRALVGVSLDGSQKGDARAPQR